MPKSEPSAEAAQPASAAPASAAQPQAQAQASTGLPRQPAQPAVQSPPAPAPTQQQQQQQQQQPQPQQAAQPASPAPITARGVAGQLPVSTALASPPAQQHPPQQSQLHPQQQQQLQQPRSAGSTPRVQASPLQQTAHPGLVMGNGGPHWPLADTLSMHRQARAEPGAAEMRQTIASMLAGEEPVGPEIQSQGMELASEALQAPRPASEGGVPWPL